MNILISIRLLILTNATDLQANVNNNCISCSIEVLSANNNSEQQNSKTFFSDLPQIRHLKIIKSKKVKRYFASIFQFRQIFNSELTVQKTNPFIRFVFETFYLHPNSLRAPPSLI